tara:strand:- start:167 stop:670 length:504 start_codon:yes stop_codon:yes gene_type:complete
MINYNKFTVSRFSNIHLWSNASSFIEQEDFTDEQETQLNHRIDYLLDLLVKSKELFNKNIHIQSQNLYQLNSIFLNEHNLSIINRHHTDKMISSITDVSSLYTSVVRSIRQLSNQTEFLPAIIHITNFLENPKRYLLRIETEIKRAEKTNEGLTDRYNIINSLSTIN